MENLNKEDKYIRARERVEEIKKFYSNLFAYIIVNLFLAGLNYYTDRWAHPWFLWPVFGWGLGIAVHASKVFGWNPFLNKEWEQRKIKEFMDKDREDVTKTQRWE